jgi:NAD+ kinase
MLKQRHGSQRGLVVYVHYYQDSQIFSSSLLRYVDKQLRHSKRFDAEGIERDHPDLFIPFPQRRTSSSHSLSSLSSTSTNREDGDEGQLRYWTSSMCSHSSHLFDFVVTVSVELKLSICCLRPISSAAMAPFCSHPGCSSALYRQFFPLHSVP